MKIELKIAGCEECDFLSADDMSNSFTCKLKWALLKQRGNVSNDEYNSTSIRLRKGQLMYPDTPLWCPINENDIMLKRN